MKKKVFLVLAILLGLVLVSGVSYAFFTVIIKGNDTAKENVVVTGNMELTYTDGEEISLNNAFPGDSISKTFTVKNTGTLTTTYNIKMVDVVNTFVDKSDLIYTLTGDNGVSVVDKVVPSSTGYLVGDIAIDSNVVHTYTLTITFKKTLDVQNDNQGVTFSGKINIDTGEMYPTLLKKINQLYANNNPELVVDDYNNIRYIGADPANYIYFNCDDYSNPTAETCEKWRIIGSFKDIEDSEGQVADRVKIMRGESIGNIAWNSNNANNWSTATLNTYLNGEYYNSLKNDITKNMIDSVMWNLGGSSTTDDVTAIMFYERERGSTVFSGNPLTWTGKIALMYPSDYGYATSGGSTTNREACLNMGLDHWNLSSVSDCKNNDYIFNSSTSQWTLTHYTSSSRYAFFVDLGGHAFPTPAYIGYGVRPVLYFDTDIKIISGEGTSDSPYVLYQEQPLTVVEKVNELYANNNSELVVDDYENIRYIGANPSNYIYFNCDDYSNPTAETCEKWRIIGSFKDIEDSEGNVAERVKIMRDEFVSTSMSWDTNGINNWVTATLNTYLNGEYYNSLKNDTTKNMIDSVVWNLGGTSTYTSASNGLAKHWYQYERGTTVYGSNPTTWTGKIALMYPSDYGYATSGGSTTSREACLNKELVNWNSSSFSDCKNNDYIFDSSTDQWTLAHHSSYSIYAFYVYDNGYALSSASYGYGVRPALYLESSAVITAGDGSEASPFVLGA